MPAPNLHAPIVHIVDDDPSIRISLPILLETALFHSQCHASAGAFLENCRPEQAGCILLDVRMPGMSGPELQAELARRQIELPIIFLTGHADLAVGVAAMKQGAMDFLTKPVDGEHLLERVAAALELDRERRRLAQARREVEVRLARLTGRERQVLGLALAGTSNADIAARLGISLRTVEGHRSRIYLKTGVESVLELALQAANVGIRLD